jgi:hypothetical protein
MYPKLRNIKVIWNRVAPISTLFLNRHSRGAANEKSVIEQAQTDEKPKLGEKT